MKRTLIHLSLLLLTGAVVCTVAYRLIGVRVEADGTLQEAFPLIPPRSVSYWSEPAPLWGSLDRCSGSEPNAG